MSEQSEYLLITRWDKRSDNISRTRESPTEEYAIGILREIGISISKRRNFRIRYAMRAYASDALEKTRACARNSQVG